MYNVPPTTKTSSTKRKEGQVRQTRCMVREYEPETPAVAKPSSTPHSPTETPTPPSASASSSSSSSSSKWFRLLLGPATKSSAKSSRLPAPYGTPTLHIDTDTLAQYLPVFCL